MKISSMKRILAITLAALFFNGCFSVETAIIKSTGKEHVLVSNYGWYLFDVIPILCGNASCDAFLPMMLFRNDVTMDKIQKRFFIYADEHGKDASDLVYSNREQVLFEFPGSNISIPLPYLLTYREMQLSGVLSAKNGARK